MKKPPHRCSMQGRKKLRGTTLVLHVSFKAVSNHEGSKQPPYMAFSEGGLGETALWPPKSGFPQKTLFLKETRLHSADIGAARRGLNVLASACSGAMFPRVPPPPFTFRGSLWALRRGTLPFLACMTYLTVFCPVCQGFFCCGNRIVHLVTAIFTASLRNFKKTLDNRHDRGYNISRLSAISSVGRAPDS